MVTIMSILRRLRQKNCKFKDSLSNLIKSCLRKQQKGGTAMNAWELILCAFDAFLPIVTNGLNSFIISKQTVVGHLLGSRYYTGPSP